MADWRSPRRVLARFTRSVTRVQVGGRAVTAAVAPLDSAGLARAAAILGNARPPGTLPPRLPSAASLLRAVAAPSPSPAGRHGSCFVTVCTVNHLHFARALVESCRRHHPEAAVYVVVADWDGRELLIVDGATPVAGHAVAPRDLPFMSLKYSATDLCCALKPHALQHLVATTDHRQFVYLDSDIYLYAPLRELLARLADASLVVIPHTTAPLPFPERFHERPSLGDLAFAGPFNAGLFAFVVDQEVLRFLALWQEMVTAPGAFLVTQGGQMEQNAFNWVSCFSDRVSVLRDPAYNVAYWNLHDRSLRCSSLDDELGEPTWTVNGRPLVAYHFSGFSPLRPSQLSRHDNRYSLYTLPSLARLADTYTERLLALGAEEQSAIPYGFERFPSGIPVDARMRYLFKAHETYLWRDVDPWSPEGESHYCTALLLPIPYTGSLLPALFDEIFRERPDLQSSYRHARLRPHELLRWIGANGIYEYGYEALFDRYRPTTLSATGLRALAEGMDRFPESFADLAAPLRGDRHRLLERLDAAGLEDLAVAVRTTDVELFHLSIVWAIRRVFDERLDLQRAFPEPLGADLERFADWIREWGHRESFLPPEAADVFLATAGGRSLARVFSYLSRNWVFMEHWPLALVGEGAEELATHLMAVLRHGVELDLEDVVMFLWTMAVRPWEGIGLTIDLPINARRQPSPWLPEGQELLLQPVLQRDRRFRDALDRYRREHGTARGQLQEACARQPRDSASSRHLSVLEAVDHRRAGGADRSLPRRPVEGGRAARPPRTRLRPGVNLFGYHKSPIGLGTLTQGLAMALASCGTPQQRVVVGNVAMEPDLLPRDFVRTWDPSYDTNLFVSYPHMHEMLLGGQPEHVVAGRRAIAYLAWEQRDGSHYWPTVYADFDQVWALSGFAAESIGRFLGRRVETVPCVVDFDSFPAPATKVEVGLDPDLFTFLYVFDANSSIERKNPEAAIRAFAGTFAAGEPVELALRVSNAHRLDHRQRLRRLLQAIPPGLNIRLLLEPLSRHDLLRLLSAADCYVSLHRAEGFGYTCAEAMALGRPVIASAYSGNLEFMSADNSFLVRCGEREVEIPDGPFQRGSVWGDPDVDDAGRLMRQVFENRRTAAAIGLRAAADVRRGLSAAVVGRHIAALLGYPAPAQASRGGTRLAVPSPPF